LDAGSEPVDGWSGGPCADRPVFDQFDEIAGRFPEALAIDDGQDRLSYRELLAGALGLGDEIARSAPQGGVVAIAAATARLPLAMLACLFAGRPFMAMDPRDPAERRRRILEDAGAALLITDEGAEEMWPPRAGGAAIRGDLDSPASIIYTSGSTGLPKGIVNSQRALLQRVSQYAGACHITERDALLPLGGLATIAGQREILAALLSGAALHLDRVERVGLSGLRAVIARKRPTMIYSVPSLLRAVLSPEAAADFASLRVLRVGGEEVRWSDVALARRSLPKGCLIQVGYSSTESTGSQWFVPADQPADDAAVPVGYMLPGTEFAVVDEDGLQAAPGEVGMLVIRGRAVALGEWRSGALVPGSIVTDRTDPALRIHATGDLVRIAADGLVRFAGRNDRQVKLNGLRVELEELEHHLRMAPGVEDAVALRSAAGELIAFAAVGAQEHDLIERELHAALRSGLPRGLQPARLNLVDAIPRLASGKVDQRALRRRDAEAMAKPREAERADAVETHDAWIEAAVVSAWAAFLPRSSRPDRPWDEEGGDSLALLNFVLDLERRLGAPLPLESFSPHMSRSDAVRIASALADGAAPAAAEGRPTVFFFPGMNGDIPASARFRTRLQDELAFVTLRYPPLTAIAGDAPSLEAIARGLAAQIEALQPTGELLFAGYSLGGAIAFETAAQLAAKSRPVRFLGVLDTDLTLSLPLDWGRVATPVIRAMALASERALPRRVLLQALAHAPLSPRRRAALTREVEGALRLRALERWVRTAKPVLPTHGVLFLAEQPRPGAPPDLGWGPLLRRLDIVSFSGDHVSCLGGEPHVDGNCAKFGAALRTCISGASARTGP
jgi:acyl-CoA synthetase (AMP-forming)/AMP-acid ligase II/thioesterase domain-containing protein